MKELTKQQAKLIIEAHDILDLLDDAEEMELLELNNPELAEAYYALHRFTYGNKEKGKDKYLSRKK